MLRPGQAKLVKAGSDIVFQMHYTANGTAGVDQSSVGVIFAKEKPKERIITMAASNGKFTAKFKVKKNKVRYRAVLAN